jgi:hypothetical protein
MNPVDVICLKCANSGAVNRVTADLCCGVCRTGEHLDLYTGSPEQLSLIASVRAPRPPLPDFKAFMLGASGDPLRGWSEYEGPMPGPNQMSNHVGPVVCPTCLGSKVDVKDDAGPCRACRGKGVLTPTTSELDEPQVYRHRYPSTQTEVPFMGRRKKGGRTSVDPLGSPEQHIRETTPGYSPQGPQGPRVPQFDHDNLRSHYPKADTRSPAMGYGQPRDYSQPGAPFHMPGTSCPTCGTGPLALTKDHRENAWASCPTCGPLADIDAHPEINPYDLPPGFTPASGYKAARKLVPTRKTGRLLATAVKVERENPGLSRAQAVWLARQSLRRHPEPR